MMRMMLLALATVVAASSCMLFVAGLAGYDNLLPEPDAPPRLVLVPQAWRLARVSRCRLKRQP